MGIKRIIDTSFWTDDKVVNYFSVEDKYFFLYLMTNPHTTQLGIYPINKRYMAFETGYSIENINILLDRFQNKYGIIRYSEKTGEIAIKNYLKHSIVKGGKPVEDLLKKEISEVKDQSLVSYIKNTILKEININITVKNILININENDNDNDNENDVSWYDSSDDSWYDSSVTTPDTHKKPVKKISNSSKEKSIPSTVEQVIEYMNEIGCPNFKDEAEAFFDHFSSNGWKVGGKSPMKDWKAACRNWKRNSNSNQFSKTFNSGSKLSASHVWTDASNPDEFKDYCDENGSLIL